MLASAAASNPGDNVSFVHADSFAWRSPARYEAVFFGFWLSHVPAELFAAFWEQVAGSLGDGGRVARLAELGWDFDMHEHGPYFWGSGARSPCAEG
jgi:hypothetical protein